MILKWLNISAKTGICLLAGLLMVEHADGQHRLDTLRLDNVRLFSQSHLMSSLVKKGVDAITRDPDTIRRDAIKNGNPYLEDEGRYIRHIYVNTTGFEQPIPNAKKLEALGVKVLNTLHVNTRDWVIRNNLFIREGKPVDPYQLADNERYLRTLEFVRDARITVIPVSDDTVDIEVASRDVFTLSGGLDIGSLQHMKGSISEANLAGMGQKIKFTTLIDQGRTPMTGYKVLYTKNSIGGSFISGSIGYSTVSPTLYENKEEEKNYFISLDRPLVSSGAKVAGGISYTYRMSQDAYADSRPAGMFYDYAMRSFDVWAGYNIASGRLNNNKIRDRRFLSLRYVQNRFDKVPVQVTGFDPLFNDMKAVFGQLTFFRQDFYKTSYIYGFGVTEDIPHGYNVSLIGGWQKQLDLERPYAGISADGYTIGGKGAFYRYYMRTGAFYKGMQLEDAGLLLGTSIYSKLMQWHNTRVRQYLNVSYAGLFNQHAGDLLRINNPFGLHEFNYAEITGDQRIGILSESSFFLKYKFLGFKFAPFVTANAVVITPKLGNFKKADVYTGLGGGIRTRNEALVFGTVELRGVYFPRMIEGQATYKILLSTNLKYKYNSSYVTKPDIARLNVDDGL